MNLNKNPKDIFALTTFALICLMAFPLTVYAVPPPDFLFNVGGQIVQVFSVAVIFLTAIFSVSYKFIKVKLSIMGPKKAVFISLSLIAIVGISIGSAYFYGSYKQNLEYDKWLEESQQYAGLPGEQEAYLEREKIARAESIESGIGEKGDVMEKGDVIEKGETLEKGEIDKLQIGDAPKISRQVAGSDEHSKFISSIANPNNDANINFIEDYYEAIANQNLEIAYEMSKKSTSLSTFKGWYKDTTKITLDNLQRIDDTASSLELTLYEGGQYTRYGTLLTLKFESDNPVQIAKSSVRILSEGKLIEKGDQAANFYSENHSSGISISNTELNSVLNSGKSDYIILDAREDLEYENGYLQGSTHIRFADLQAGKWIEIPEDKYVYVLCWSGIRGKEVAEFLRTKDIVASYLENGANGWVEWGGAWVGNIKFSQKYTEAKYKKLFTTNEVKSKVGNGTILVDTREPWKFQNWHIEGSVNIPMMYTPTSDIRTAFAQVPSVSSIITVCDDYVNCFDAKITAVELEERGHEFLGRYNKPWEYEN